MDGSGIRGRQGWTDTARVNEASWMRLTGLGAMQIRLRRFIIRG